MGLMDKNPEDLEIDLVRETMNALKDQVELKLATWRPKLENDEERILANYLLQGDNGFTVPEMFTALRAANLEFISMVNRWQFISTLTYRRSMREASLQRQRAAQRPHASYFGRHGRLRSSHDVWCEHRVGHCHCRGDDSTACMQPSRSARPLLQC